MIHHAGMASTWEAIRFGKSALMLPLNADQKVVSTYVESLGLGVRAQESNYLNVEKLSEK